MGNQQILARQKRPADEYYTQPDIIKREIENYREQLKGKRILCPFDSPADSDDNPPSNSFSLFFLQNFARYELKEITTSDITGRASSSTEGVMRFWSHDGDFFNQDVQRLVSQSDIVISNPPFSKIGLIVQSLLESEKDFILLAPLLCITRHVIGRAFLKGKIRYGYFLERPVFKIPEEYIDVTKTKRGADGSLYSVPLTSVWITTLQTPGKTYKEPCFNTDIAEFKRYDKCDCIHVDDFRRLPRDYYDDMAISIASVHNLNPAVFETVRFIEGTIDGKKKFHRLVVRRKK